MKISDKRFEELLGLVCQYKWSYLEACEERLAAAKSMAERLSDAINITGCCACHGKGTITGDAGASDVDCDSCDGTGLCLLCSEFIVPVKKERDDG